MTNELGVLGRSKRLAALGVEGREGTGVVCDRIAEVLPSRRSGLVKN